MGYQNLSACVADLEKNGHLIRIKEEVDPNLVMSSIHQRVYEKEGPALLFENIKGSKFPAVSNLFGTLERSKFMFRDSLDAVKQLVELKNNPMAALKNPFKYATSAMAALSALPMKSGSTSSFTKIKLSEIPMIINWPMDGGAFVTMPQVYTEDVDAPGIMSANLGMYRIQLNGNEYHKDEEIGLHYQLHRGIGVHQTKSNKKGEDLKVSIFVGGPPSHPLAAVMPLPEGLSEMTFAGALGKRRFRYFYDQDGFCISTDADFIITGTVSPGANKPEGPFGDHLGYYSLKHDFPLLKVKNVYHRKNPIWSFTVVGRPPQEDTSFGALIHDITGAAIPKEIPGLHEVNAVDAAGVHPLLFAIGSERYTPYLETKRPQELLTLANHILGKSQLSLAKYLFICAKEDNANLKTSDVKSFFKHMLERIDLTRDLHFYTKTTIDTLDYSGTDINAGSKVAIAAVGKPIRKLAENIPTGITFPNSIHLAKMAMNGVLILKADPFINAIETQNLIRQLESSIPLNLSETIPLIVLCDDADFTAASTNNFVWVTFTKSNPSHDIHGIGAFIENKHWGCRGSLIIDARTKTHHAPALIKDQNAELFTDSLGAKGKSLFGII